jgi:multidrug resistance efflux pump
MLELLLCSLVTIVPDYLYRRYRQGKRWGKELTLYSVWFELRWGITACLMLTVALITIIFYFHPSTTSVTAFFRTVPIVPETNGRVAEIFVGPSSDVQQGAPLFRLDSSAQEAAVETAKRRILETDASMTVARTDIAAADGQIQQAQSALKQAQDELDTKQELQRRAPGAVATREIDRLQVRVEGQRGAVAAATAAKKAAEERLNSVLPAQKASAEAALAQAQVDLSKTVVRAGVAGRVEQFFLRVGDIVNPFMRPAGVLIPAGAGRRALTAGFNQLEAQVMKVGMIAEAVCISKPFTVIPLVVTSVQDYIAAGQFRGGEQLVDPQQVRRPGTILVFMEPLYEGGLSGVAPGSSCIANAYTNNHDLLASKDIGTLRWLYLHGVDAVGIVHAMLLRVQALLLPVKMLVFSGH